jgi:hypothetical protein
MTISFENDSDFIVYAFEKIISFARENQYLFVANCVWWIAGVTGLDSGLIIHIDNLHTRRQITLQKPASVQESTIRHISPIHRDIARSLSVDQDLNELEEELIVVTKGRNQKSKANLRTVRTNQIQKLSKNQRKKLARANLRAQGNN